MPNTTDNPIGIYYPVDADKFDPSADMALQAQSVHDVFVKSAGFPMVNSNEGFAALFSNPQPGNAFWSLPRGGSYYTYQTTGLGSATNIWRNIADPVHLANPATANSIYAGAKQNDIYFDQSIGAKMRYFEAGSTTNNPTGMKTPGWYRVEEPVMYEAYDTMAGGAADGNHQSIWNLPTYNADKSNTYAGKLVTWAREVNGAVYFKVKTPGVYSVSATMRLPGAPFYNQGGTGFRLLSTLGGVVDGRQERFTANMNGGGISMAASATFPETSTNTKWYFPWWKYTGVAGGAYAVCDVMLSIDIMKF